MKAFVLVEMTMWEMCFLFDGSGLMYAFYLVLGLSDEQKHLYR